MRHRAFTGYRKDRLFTIGLIASLFLAYLVYALLIGLLGGHDDEAASSRWKQPYGGCDEAYLYPDSLGYAECKAHGLVP